MSLFAATCFLQHAVLSASVDREVVCGTSVEIPNVNKFIDVPTAWINVDGQRARRMRSELVQVLANGVCAHRIRGITEDEAALVIKGGLLHAHGNWTILDSRWMSPVDVAIGIAHLKAIFAMKSSFPDGRAFLVMEDDVNLLGAPIAGPAEFLAPFDHPTTLSGLVDRCPADWSVVQLQTLTYPVMFTSMHRRWSENHMQPVRATKHIPTKGPAATHRKGLGTEDVEAPIKCGNAMFSAAAYLISNRGAHDILATWPVFPDPMVPGGARVEVTRACWDPSFLWRECNAENKDTGKRGDGKEEESFWVPIWVTDNCILNMDIAGPVMTREEARSIHESKRDDIEEMNEHRTSMRWVSYVATPPWIPDIKKSRGQMSHSKNQWFHAYSTEAIRGWWQGIDLREIYAREINAARRVNVQHSFRVYEQGARRRLTNARRNVSGTRVD